MGAKRAQLAAQQRDREEAAEALQRTLRAELDDVRREREQAAMAAGAEGQRREAMERQREAMHVQLATLDR